MRCAARLKGEHPFRGRSHGGVTGPSEVGPLHEAARVRLDVLRSVEASPPNAELGVLAEILPVPVSAHKLRSRRVLIPAPELASYHSLLVKNVLRISSCRSATVLAI